MNLPHVEVKPDPSNRKVFNVYVDGDLHTYGYCDKRTANQAAQVVRAELHVNFHAAEMNTQHLINQILRSN